MAGSISSLGLGSGLDLQGILDKLKSVDKIPIVNQQARQVEYKTQLAEFETVNTKLLTMKNIAFDLSLNDTFDSRAVSSSDESVLAASGTSTAVPGRYELAVTALARKNSWQSSGVAGEDSAIATSTGNFSYTINGHQTTVAVSANMTLEQLMNAINDDEENPGVTASIMDDGSGGSEAFHLVLVSRETGETNAVTIDTNDTDLTFNEIQAAGTLNAQFTLNGISYQRGGNTIDDVLPGVTLELTGTGSTMVKVESDTESVAEKITSLVEAYNEVIEEIAANSAYDEETGKGGTLSGISTITGIKGQLNATLFASVDGLKGQYSSFTDLGLEYNRDGTISIDEETLNQALTEHPDSVRELFVGPEDSSGDGLAGKLNDQLRFITKFNGLISMEKDRVQSTIDRLDKQIKQAQERLDARYETMAKTFAALDKFMSNMQAQGEALTQQINSYNNLFSKK